jgi:hypothetical protein
MVAENHLEGEKFGHWITVNVQINQQRKLGQYIK